MNFGTLKSRWASWSKQTLDAELLAETVEVVEGDVFTDVRWLDNQVYTELVALDGVVVAGAVHSYVRSSEDAMIRSVSANGRVLAATMTDHILAKWRNASGNGAEDYAIVGPDIWIAPGQADVQIVSERAFPALANDSDTNELLTRHPQVYIHAGVKHIHTYFQDAEMAGVSDALYATAVARVNGLDITLAFGATPSVRAG